jgi:hypothetical protein
MADLILHTQILEIDGNSNDRPLNVCLLMYDEPYFSDERLSNDLREQLELKPTLSRVYLLAPLVNSEDILRIVRDGSARLRVSEWAAEDGAFLRVITAEKPLDIEPIQLFENYLIMDSSLKTEVYRKRNLSEDACEGWLFDLFVINKAMVLAPVGVHFGKTSGKHSDRFLRAANVLSSSAACRLLAFLCLPLIPPVKFRQIYVDTLPLISLGFAITEVGKALGLSVASGMVVSFGSYQGIQSPQEYRSSDLVLVSASTSGSLVEGLIDRGAVEGNIITLYYLQAKAWARTKGKVLCDLTYKRERFFGYAEVLSYKHSSCPFCTAGSMLAEFEGDQFLLQRRRTKRLKIVKDSQAMSAREFFDLATKIRAIFVELVGPGRSKYSDITINVHTILGAADAARALVTFKLRRVVPTPLDFVVADDLTIRELSDWTVQNGKATIPATTAQLTAADLDETEPMFEAGVLVYFGMLHNDFKARSVNRALRKAAPRGSITYFVVVMMCESPEARRDLATFLGYGERGPSTFLFEPVYQILISQRQERSSWDLERDLLAEILQEEQSAPELQMRLNFLTDNVRTVDDVFMPGQLGPLTISEDFVYLDTKKLRTSISQADVYAVACNLLAACRNDNRDMVKPVPRGSEPLVWESSIYGQVLLCPRNFKDYNDGVLHAALLRGAFAAELRYDTDDLLSEEMLEIMLNEIDSWKRGAGQALAEFSLAVSTGRLKLKTTHLEEFRTALINGEGVPHWIKVIAKTYI